MTPAKTLAVVAGALVIAVAVVGFLRARGTQSYPSVAAVADALRGEGIECNTPTFVDNETKGIDAVGYCASSIGDYSIFVFDDPDRARDEVRWDFKPLRDVDPLTEDIFVVGSNWIVIARSNDAAERIKDAIGGEIHT